MEQKSFSTEEWRQRCDLAALFRILHLLGIEDLIYTHSSARIPGSQTQYLVNPYGAFFEEVTASGLATLEMIRKPDDREKTVNQAGFTIHGGIYEARPDVACIIHTHSRAGAIVAASKDGLQPISQDALEVIDDLGYHDYGVPATEDERARLARDAQGANCLILRNHGLLVMGESIPSAFIRMYFLERACQIQAAASGLPGGVAQISMEVQEAVAERMRGVRQAGDYGQLLWQALLRWLERKNQQYAY